MLCVDCNCGPTDNDVVDDRSDVSTTPPPNPHITGSRYAAVIDITADRIVPTRPHRAEPFGLRILAHQEHREAEIVIIEWRWHGVAVRIVVAKAPDHARATQFQHAAVDVVPWPPLTLIVPPSHVLHHWDLLLGAVANECDVRVNVDPRAAGPS